MKKRACLLAAAFSIFLGMEAYGGQFIKDETGLWYQNADGTWPVGWFQSDTGSWYCFDENGYARTGWYEENGIRYYLGDHRWTPVYGLHILSGRRLVLV